MRQQAGYRRKGFGGKSKNHGDRKNFGRKPVSGRTAQKSSLGRNNRGEQAREVEGLIRLGTKRIGYVTSEGFKEDIRIDFPFLNSALHGDTVKVLLHATQRSQREREERPQEQTGEVTTITKRARNKFVGTLNGEFLLPDDRRIYADVYVPNTPQVASQDGQKVLVEITKWNNNRFEGVVREVLGAPGAHETEIRSILAASGIVYDFPTEVEAEAQELKTDFDAAVARELKTRRDMRDTLTFTIDPADAKDFDDAISLRMLESGRQEVGVHIADVSYFVKPGTVLDREATSRANSVYLVDRTIPMLPEVLSANLCSLVPDQDRLTYSAIFVMDKTGKVESEWFGRTVIHSAKRFTYEEAAAVLEMKKGLYASELATLNSIAQSLHKERVKTGSVIFEKDEVKIELGPDKRPIRISVKERLATHKLVEEFMLLANKHVARYLSKAVGKLGGAAMYRIHDVPDPERILLLKTYLRSLGYKMESSPKRFGAREINELFAQIKGEDIEHLVQTAVLRSMAKAIYSTSNIGHFGLGFDFYTHFTSPIRRYPDLLVHRLLTKYLAGKPIDAAAVANFAKIASYSSTKEKEAESAERESIKYKQAEYMAGRLITNKEQVYEGVITGVTEWGIFVEDKSTKCEGMVRLSSLSDDYYEFNEKKFALVGSRTKKVYRLGDRIAIKLSAVDVARHQITWELASQ